MEVHHHPHVEKKRFKQYVLEFLMIFLAVTLGFFAENIREKISDHEKSETYAHEMLGDLSADTTALRGYITYFSTASKNVDTLLQLLADKDPKDIPTGKLYWYGLFSGARNSFIPNDATFQQMKSSGSLRFFNRTLSQKIAQYDGLCRRMETTEQNDQLVYIEVRKLRSQIFEFRYNNLANDVAQANYKSFDQKRIDSFMLNNPPLLTYDKTIFNEYVEMARSRFLRRNQQLADTLLNHATELAGLIKSEYDIHD